LLELVRAQIAAVLGHTSAAAVPADRTLHDLGVDSLTALQLRNGIGRAVAERLPATVVFDHPTALALARSLATRLAGDEQAEQADGYAYEPSVERADESAVAEATETTATAGTTTTTTAGMTEETVSSATDEELFALLEAELGLGDERSTDGR
jgi:acyl carrier protein